MESNGITPFGDDANFHKLLDRTTTFKNSDEARIMEKIWKVRT
jgi:hypothetical protein